MAAPHVTGLASYLLALEPSLTYAQVRELLVANAVPVAPDVSDCIDAFATVLDIDRVTGEFDVLHRLVDVDDGTIDGNQRVGQGSPFTNEDADGDGGVGDGNVDMSDFRRWRDWLLQIQNDPSLFFDGDSAHAKRDVNGNGVVEEPAEENVYPRGDFNGDGVLDEMARSYVPGAIQDSVTDLEVLQSAFNDPHYDAADLPGLIESADITVDAETLLDVANADHVLVTYVLASSGAQLQQRTSTSQDPIQVVTLPADEYHVTASVLDADGNELGSAQVSPLLLLGEDWFWQPEVEPTLILLSVEFPERLAPEDSALLKVTALQPDDAGQLVPLPGVEIEARVDDGWLIDEQGVTNEAGIFQTYAFLEDRRNEVIVVLEAQTPDGLTASDTVSARRRNEIWLGDRDSHVFAMAQAGYWPDSTSPWISNYGGSESNENDDADGPLGAFRDTVRANGNAEWANGSVTAIHLSEVEQQASELTLTFQALVDGSTTVDSAPAAVAWIAQIVANTAFDLDLAVWGDSAEYALEIEIGPSVTLSVGQTGICYEDGVWCGDTSVEPPGMSATFTGKLVGRNRFRIASRSSVGIGTPWTEYVGTSTSAKV